MSEENSGVVAKVYDGDEHVANLTNPDLVSQFKSCGWFEVKQLRDDK